MWNVSACFLWVCVGCFGRLLRVLARWFRPIPVRDEVQSSVACGMFRHVFYGCVSVAWEVASGAYPMVSPHSLSGRSPVVGSLWNVSACFYGCVSVALGGCFRCLPDGFASLTVNIHIYSMSDYTSSHMPWLGSALLGMSWWPFGLFHCFLFQEYRHAG